MLDGAARIGDLVNEVARQEMPAIAMTDHGNVFGAFDFYKQAVKTGVKPIIGIEAYVAPESRFDKKKVQWADGGDDDVSGGGAYTHMTILAENNHGLANLFRLSSLASLEGYYYKPRMDRITFRYPSTPFCGRKRNDIRFSHTRRQSRIVRGGHGGR